MWDYTYLSFADAAEWESMRAQVQQADGNGGWIDNAGIVVDVLGHNKTPATYATDGSIVTPPVLQAEWLVNIAAEEVLPEALQPYVTYPASPVRVFTV